MSTSPRWLSSVAAGLALAAAVAVPAQAGLADQVGATFGLMLQEVVSAFPPIEGLVVQVDGDRIYMDLSQKDGLLLGQEYTVFRKGEVFRHPASGKPLGRYEETLGYAQVRRVEPTFAEAVFVPGEEENYLLRFYSNEKDYPRRKADWTAFLDSVRRR